MIDIALFGLGRIGIMHGKNLMRNKDFNLKYVYDIDKNLTKKYSKILKAGSVNNPNIIFKDKKIKAVFIASTTNTHIKFILEGVKNKKIIFCEKPLDLSIKKINKCKKKIKNLNPKIQLGFNRRYDPGHNNLKKQLLKNKIGKLEKIIITSRDPAPPTISYLKSSGGIFRDMMIHDFDLCRLYLGNDEVNEIHAFTSSFVPFYKKIKDHELAVVTMKSKKGVICVITNSRHCSFGYDQRVELFGKKGMLISGNKKENSTELFNSNQTNSQKPFLNFFIERYNDAYNIQLKELISLHKNKTKSRSTFEDGYLALKLANAAYNSLKLKKTIKV